MGAKVSPQVLAEINADPDIRAAMVDGWGQPITDSTNHDVSQALSLIFSKYGHIPVSFHDGQWEEDTGESWVDTALQAAPFAVMGGALAGPAIAAAAGHGGGGAAAINAAGMGPGGPLGTAASTAATSGLSWGTALRYAPGLISGAVNGYLGNKNARLEREQQQRLANQRTALTETQLDPFRGTMHQTQDIARLERAGQGPRSYSPGAGSPYARYFNPANAAPPISDTMRTATANAQQLVARGEGRVPSMVDPNNWGQTGTTDLTAPQPAGGGSTASALLRRRLRPLRMPPPPGQDDASSWLNLL